MNTPMLRGYAWFPQYTYPLESQWSLLHKFARWNVLGVQALHRAIGRGMNVTVNLMTGQFVDVRKFAAATGLSSKLIPGTLCTSYVLPSDRSLIAPTLRYCPDCLALGYHSAIHQLLLFNACQIHNKRLQAECPRCHAVVPAEMTGINLKSCYGCPCCRYVFADTDKPRASALCAEIVSQIEHACNELQSIKQARTTANTLSTFDVRVMGDRLHMLLPLWRSAYAGVSEKGLQHSTHKLRPTWLNLWAIYKSVRRNVAKHHIRQHRRCLHEVRSLGGVYEGYRYPENIHCPEVHAYMQWRMYWESRVCFAELHLDSRPSDLVWKPTPELTVRESSTIFAHECLLSYYLLFEAARSTNMQGDFVVMTRDNIASLIRRRFDWLVEKTPAENYMTIHCWIVKRDEECEDVIARDHHMEVQRAVQQILADLRRSRETCHTYSCNEKGVREVVAILS